MLKECYGDDEPKNDPYLANNNKIEYFLIY